jgi:hypothetical protein
MACSSAWRVGLLGPQADLGAAPSTRICTVTGPISAGCNCSCARSTPCRTKVLICAPSSGAKAGAVRAGGDLRLCCGQVAGGRCCTRRRHAGLRQGQARAGQGRCRGLGACHGQRDGGGCLGWLVAELGVRMGFRMGGQRISSSKAFQRGRGGFAKRGGAGQGRGGFSGQVQAPMYGAAAGLRFFARRGCGVLPAGQCPPGQSRCRFVAWLKGGQQSLQAGWRVSGGGFGQGALVVGLPCCRCQRCGRVAGVRCGARLLLLRCCCGARGRSLRCDGPGSRGRLLHSATRVVGRRRLGGLGRLGRFLRSWRVKPWPLRRALRRVARAGARPSRSAPGKNRASPLYPGWPWARRYEG